MKATATSVIGTVVSSFVVIYVLLLLYGLVFISVLLMSLLCCLSWISLALRLQRPSPKPQNQS